jgi:hypothetical protein
MNLMRWNFGETNRPLDFSKSGRRSSKLYFCNEESITNQFIGLFGLKLGHKSIEEENFGTNYI